MLRSVVCRINAGRRGFFDPTIQCFFLGKTFVGNPGNVNPIRISEKYVGMFLKRILPRRHQARKQISECPRRFLELRLPRDAAVPKRFNRLLEVPGKSPALLLPFVQLGKSLMHLRQAGIETRFQQVVNELILIMQAGPRRKQRY